MYEYGDLASGNSLRHDRLLCAPQPGLRGRMKHAVCMCVDTFRLIIIEKVYSCGSVYIGQAI